MEHKVRARVIIEMLGSPKAHVLDTLKDYVSKLKEDKTLKFVSEELSTPEQRDGGLFAVFTEIDIWFKDVSHLLGFCFDALPSSVEILEPDTISLPSKEFEGVLNDLQAKLHTVDLALKKMRATASVLDNNAMNTLRNFIIYALKEPKTSLELSKLVGLPADKVEQFIEPLIKEKKVKKTGSTYSS